MMLSRIVFILAATVYQAQSHYVFDKLILGNGTITESWQFVRENTRTEKYMPTKFINSFGTTPLDVDFRCNQGSFASAAKTQVAEIVAGETLGLQVAGGATMKHPGPAQVYLSKASGDVREYDGSGDWFKIYQETLCGSTTDGLQDTDWCSWDKDRVVFTVPSNTPSGEYLVRVEQIGLHGAHVGEAEFYYSCAQLRISGSGTTSPAPLVKIPGIYSNEDPAIHFSIYGATNYPYYPGPAVWTGNATSSDVPTPGNATSARVSTGTPAATRTWTSDPQTVPVSTFSPSCPISKQKARHGHRKHQY